MTGLLVAVLVAQAGAAPPTLTVVNTRRTGATQDEGLSMTTRVATLLADADVPVALSADAAAAKLAGMGTKDPGICQGKKACELELARQLEVTVLVTVSVAKLGEDLGVGVQALRANDGASLATDSLLLVGKSRLTGEQLQPFIARLREGLGLKAAGKQTAEQQQPPVLVPKNERPVVLPAPLPPSTSDSHAVGITLVAGAGACVVAAVVLGVLAANAAGESGRLEDGHSAHSHYGSQQWASRANGLITASTVTGGLALGLGAVALITW